MRSGLALLVLPLVPLACDSHGTVVSPPVGASVLMYHDHINRDGYFQDPLLAGATSVALDPTFSATFPDNVWTTPLYVDSGVGGNGTYYIATESNHVYAFDETGAPSWPAPASFGIAAAGAGSLYPQSGLCGNIAPLGITGTPAIDLASRLMVFDAVSGDGSASNYIATHTIYGMSIDDGSTRWSVDVSTLTAPTGLTFSPQVQNQRSAVLIVNGVAYVGYGAHLRDCADFHGWLVGVPLSGTGAQAWATQTQGGGIWGVGGPSSDGTSIYVTTGNGIGQPGSCNAMPPEAGAPWADSEALLRFGAGPTFSGQTADYFALANWFAEDCADTDLGGAGPLVIDDPAMSPPTLLLAEGKDGFLYLLDRGDLGGVAAAPYTAGVGSIQASTDEIIDASAWATIAGTTYVVLRPHDPGPSGVGCPAGTSGDLVGVKLDPAAPQKMTVAWCADSGGHGSPIITSSDGTNDGLVWTFGAQGDDELHAFHIADGSVAFTSAPVAGANVQSFSTLAEVKGRLFVAGNGALYAFVVE